MAKPMPSAGIIPLLQSFCPNTNNHVNKHGFIDFPSARYVFKIVQLLAVRKCNKCSFLLKLWCN